MGAGGRRKRRMALLKLAYAVDYSRAVFGHTPRVRGYRIKRTSRMTKVTLMKRSAGLVVTAIYAILALVATAASATTPPPHPDVLWAHVSPASLGRFGGDIEVTAAVKDATSCALEVLVNGSLPVGFSPAPKNCAKGAYSARVVIGSNPGRPTRMVSLALVARKHGLSVTDRFVVEVAGRAPATTTTTQATTTTVKLRPTATGASTTTTPASTTTTAASTTTTAGVFLPPPPPPATTTTTTGGNTSTSAATTTTTALTTTTTSPTTTTTAPTTTTTGSTTTTTGSTTTTTGSTTTTTGSTTTTTTPPNFQGATSTNWSGFAVLGGTYTSAQGTFTVPALTASATCNEELSEWVGIDGYNNSELIQAGIGESMVGPYDNQRCTAGQYYVWGWWEILPASMTPVTMTVDAGDQVTVDISQVNGSNWEIVLSDTTRNETVTEDETYSGPGASAEWIVEAPYDSYVCGGYCVPEPYSPAVPFSGISCTGSLSTVYDVTMRQSGVNLSTPSLLSQWPADFSVSYTGSQNGPLSRGLVPLQVGAGGQGPSHPIFQG